MTPWAFHSAAGMIHTRLGRLTASAPRGLDPATLWINSLTVPTLAERVYRERRVDLETRSGELMALFHCAKVLNDSGASTDPVFEFAAREAAKLVADLQC